MNSQSSGSARQRQSAAGRQGRGRAAADAPADSPEQPAVKPIAPRPGRRRRSQAGATRAGPAAVHTAVGHQPAALQLL